MLIAFSPLDPPMIECAVDNRVRIKLLGVAPVGKIDDQVSDSLSAIVVVGGSDECSQGDTCRRDTASKFFGYGLTDRPDGLRVGFTTGHSGVFRHVATEWAAGNGTVYADVA